jgi:hypothetical protein
MANTKISGLSNSLTKSTAASADLFPIVDVSASETKKMTYQELTQPLDSQFRIAGSSDVTKLAAFEVDGFTTATTRTFTLPNATTTLVGTDVAQTLTSKTLTSPQINFGSDANGDMIYRAAGATSRLPIGTSGQIMQVSVGGLPEWAANPAAADASTTAKGVLEVGTVAEREARTASGGTGAKVAITTENLGAWNSAGYAADAGASDTYAVTLPIVPSSYYTGMIVEFKANTANTGAATLNVNSLGAKTIKKNATSDLSDNDIAANQIVQVIYDGTNFQLLSPTAVASPKMILGRAVPITGSAGNIRYIQITGSETTGASPEPYGFIVPFAGTIRNLYVRSGSTVSTTSTTYTVRKNGTTNTSVTVSFSSGQTNTTKSDTVNTATVVAGDYITIEEVSTGANNPICNAISIELDPT